MKGKKRKRPIPWKRSDSDSRPLWPSGKPLPKFKSYEDEVRFWHSYDVEDLSESEWRELKYVPQATRRPREHVYRVRLDDREMAMLQTLAKRRGVTASVVIRELVRDAGRRAS